MAAGTTKPSWVQKRPEVCGGEACLRDTRILVCSLVQARNLGAPDAIFLENIVGLTAEDLEAAWDYYRCNPAEIDEAIRRYEVPYRTWSFRMAFLPVFAAITVFGWTFGLALIVLKYGWARVLADLSALAVTAAASAGMGLFATLCARWLTVGVGPAGLHCYDFWGHYREVHWNYMQSVRPINLFGLKYWRVYTTISRHPLWLPAFLEDMDGFRTVIRDWAGPEHPLSQAILK